MERLKTGYHSLNWDDIHKVTESCVKYPQKESIRAVCDFARKYFIALYLL